MRLMRMARMTVLLTCTYTMTSSVTLIALPNATYKTSAQKGCVFCDIILAKNHQWLFMRHKML
jgi:hypothetical protein